MEAAGELIVNAAARHLLQRGGDDGAEKIFASAGVTIDYEVHHRGGGKLGLRAKAAMLHVEEACGRVNNLADDFRRKVCAAAAKSFCLCYGAHHLLRGFGDLAVLIAISSRNGLQHAL